MSRKVKYNLKTYLSEKNSSNYYFLSLVGDWNYVKFIKMSKSQTTQEKPENNLKYKSCLPQIAGSFAVVRIVLRRIDRCVKQFHEVWRRDRGPSRCWRAKGNPRSCPSCRARKISRLWKWRFLEYFDIIGLLLPCLLQTLGLKYFLNQFEEQFFSSMPQK